MKKGIKLSFLLLFVIGLMLNQTDCFFMNHTHTHHTIESESLEADLSNQFNDSHSINPENDYSILDPQFKLSNSVSSSLLFSSTENNQQINFPFSIWQPPKSL